MENVYVMAGVPRVMQSMFEWLAPRLEGGAKIEMRAVHVVGLPEGIIAEGLGACRSTIRTSIIGSYPFYRASGNGVALVAKGPDGDAAEKAIAEVTELIIALGKCRSPANRQKFDGRAQSVCPACRQKHCRDRHAALAVSESSGQNKTVLDVRRS